MTKSRLLAVLIVLLLIDLALANQTWFTGTAGETKSFLELSGVKTSAWLSPLLILTLITSLVAFYVSGKVSAVLLSLEAVALATGLPLLVSFLSFPAQALAKSGLIEKVTGQSGTMDEISAQVGAAMPTWALFASVVALSITALWALFAGVKAWRWKKTKRVSTSRSRSSKSKKSSFDLWDSQRG